MTTDQIALQNDDLSTAAELPCLLPGASTDVFAPLFAQLSADARHQLASSTTAIAVLADRLAVLTLIDLPDDGDALVAALTLRSWLLGVTASCRLLADATDDGRAHATDTQAAATAHLTARYDRDPRAARDDGLDVVAGGLLDG